MIKKELKLIVFSAIIIAFISVFTPSLCFNLAEAYEAEGYEKPELGWSRESSVFFSYQFEYDYSDNENPIEYHKYFFLNTKVFGDSESPFSSEKNLVLRFAEVSYSVLFFVIFSYVCHKCIKDCCRKKTKYFLYAALIFSSLVIINLIYTHFSYSSLNNSILIYTEHINFLYGFYLMIIPIFLFFSAHFIQKYYFDLTEKEKKE